MRNIILVTFDSLRADHCGFMGYDRETTPALDRMAEEGIVFENAVAPGAKTPESMPVVFTGQYPTHRVNSADLNDWERRIHPHMLARDTVAEQLSRRGYHTIGFTPNSFTSRYFGFDQGFDQFRDFLDDEFRTSVRVPSALRGPIKWLRREGSFKPWEAYYDEILDSVRSVEQPYFLWVLLMDTHVPYLVPREYRSENSLFDMLVANWYRGGNHEGAERVHEKIVSAYDDTIRYADEFLGRLRADLADTDPAMVVHADHGEAFGEHGSYGHEGLLYEENVHVPLVVWNAGGSGSVGEPVSLRSLPSILHEVGDGSRESTRRFQRLASSVPAVARTETGHRYAVRGDRYKVLKTREGTFEWYDLQGDPGERSDLAGRHQDVAADLVLAGERAEQSLSEKERIQDSVARSGVTAQLNGGGTLFGVEDVTRSESSD